MLAQMNPTKNWMRAFGLRIMCIIYRRMFKLIHVIPVIMLVLLSMWICIVKIHGVFKDTHNQNPKYPDLPTTSINYLIKPRDALNEFQGPAQRFRLIDGKWTKISGSNQTRRTSSTIPQIIHQTWDKPRIPEYFVPWVISWVRHHPKWEYWFWTPEDVKQLLKIVYPGYVKIYDQYRQALSKADAMRYFVLHAYGGVYADLDLECLKPLDELIEVYPCMMTEETQEHAHLMYHRNPPNLMTTFMACRPDHPLFMLAIRGLPFTQKRYASDILKSTGPFYLDTIYHHYIKTTKNIASKDIKIFPPEYFLPTYDASQSIAFERACMEVRKNSPQFMKDTCHRWDNERRSSNKPSPVSFTNHYWVHIILKEKTWKTMKSLDIEQALNIKPKYRTKIETRESKSYTDMEQGKKIQLEYKHEEQMGWIPSNIEQY